MSLDFRHLNPGQQQAVLHGSGPLLILAGAGSGKTSTMAYRIAHLITERHTPACHILGLSFTNKAAKELKTRVVQLVSRTTAGRKALKGLTITTFHSLCARILRVHAEKLGFQAGFAILDSHDQLDILKSVLRRIHIDDRRFDPEVILFALGQAKNRFLRGAAAEEYFLSAGFLSEEYQVATAACFDAYQTQLRTLNGMDFDDLIFYTVELLRNFPDVRSFYNTHFRALLVDEYQDTNPAQFAILRALTEQHQNLCVVGDDDQSIYGWRGADSQHILQFANVYQAAKTVILDQNYRSTERILQAANQVIAKNTLRYPKKLWSRRGAGELIGFVRLEDDRAEGDFVAEEILRQCGADQAWKKVAVLYRSNSQSRIFEEALRRRQIPYQIVGGISFLERKEVKNVLAYWRVIINFKDETSLRRVLNWPSQGVGRASVERVEQLMREQGVSFYHALEIFAGQGVGVISAQLAQSSVVLPSRKLALRLAAWLESLQKLARELSEVQTGVTLVQWARNSLQRLQLRQAVEEDCDDPVVAAKKWENVEELIHCLGQWKKEEEGEGVAAFASQAREDQASAVSSSLGAQVLQDFLNGMMLEAQEQQRDEDQKEQDQKKNQVTLLTLHGAKGLEYPVVFLVGMEEGFLPHKRTLKALGEPENGEAQPLPAAAAPGDGTPVASVAEQSELASELPSELDEERRLCYVGMTRAKDLLMITYVRQRIRYGKPVPRKMSRFLTPVAAELFAEQDLSHAPDQTRTAGKLAQEAHALEVKGHLQEIMARLRAKH